MVKIHSKEEFLNRYESFLSNDEIRYGLMLGVGKRDNPNFTYIASDIDNEFVLGLLAGKNLILASNTDNSVIYKDLVEYMESNIEYPGVVGSKEHCLKFDEAYKELTEKNLSVSMKQRIYSCHKTNEVTCNEGKTRLARVYDEKTLLEWTLDFMKSVPDDYTEEDLKKMISSKVDNDTLYVLEVAGRIVSMTGRARRLDKTETISLVYTPKGDRGNGYASKLVKEVTDLILKDGLIATLYTDLENPTSNSIYKKIGFVEHCDSIMMDK